MLTARQARSLTRPMSYLTQIEAEIYNQYKNGYKFAQWKHTKLIPVSVEGLIAELANNGYSVVHKEEEHLTILTIFWD